jgi:hypothetical protein
MLVKLKMSENLREAVTFIEQGRKLYYTDTLFWLFSLPC